MDQQDVHEMADELAAARRKVAELEAELATKVDTIEQQRSAIRELSTPVIEVWAGVLCLPIVGVIDSVRSAEVTESLLRAVTEKRCRRVIIDVTGIEVMDSGTADHFIKMARAVGLLGAECVLAGISPSIAQTLVHMGVELRGIGTFRALRDALHAHVQAQAPGPR